MKSIRVSEFGEPSVLKLEEVPDPVAAAGQVVVKLHAIGVNPVETYVRKGIYGPRAFPYTPGSDGAGVVETVGPGVTAFKPGDRVYVSTAVSGTYAEKALCTVAGVHPLPASVSFEQGAALGVPYATAYQALRHRARAEAGETLLIHGATGGVGVAAVQIARAMGLRVIGTGGSQRGRSMILKEGAHHALDHTASGYLDEVMSLTGGNGVNLILEMLANVNLAKDLTVLAKFGRVVVIGNRGKIEIDPRETMKRDAEIRGMTLFNATERDLHAIHSALVAGLENGSLRPIVGQTLALAEAAKAHEEVMKPSGAFGKIVLRP
ncbi:NADPH:quinone reductase [Humisphaera borealis]|uniref:NADPH:quinone reductase n=1 Tax=Humisphaera borealis TaxID=2807512 RepID=A0A7M2WQD4_9BACT|nr:NADPH:quinone reductase [Humisphaera borealis]QOV87599.1 NADPH:quinone reductase [Humisphaera borealis]